MKSGFSRVAVGIPGVWLGNPLKNVEEICGLFTEAVEQNVDILLTPELSLTGATCGDLFFQDALHDGVEEALARLRDYTKDHRLILVVGAPMRQEGGMICATIFLQDGEILGIRPKKNLTSAEKRWFVEKQENSVDLPDMNIQLMPTSAPAIAGGAGRVRKDCTTRSKDGVLLYAGTGFGESTTDAVYRGHAIIAVDGVILAENEPFSLESTLIVAEVEPNAQKELLPVAKPSKIKTTPSQMPWQPADVAQVPDFYREIFAMQTTALAQRLVASGARRVVLGISGGLDSTLALLVTVGTFVRLDRPNTDIIGITMPGFGTSADTLANANNLMQGLGVEGWEIDIQSACLQQFSLIGHDSTTHDVVFENVQARMRANVLFNVANGEDGIVVGGGNMSELALGFTTYGGDLLAQYAVNAGLPKTLVREMVAYLAENDPNWALVADTLRNILDTPISPELLPPNPKGKIAQQTEQILGPYLLHDFFLYHGIYRGKSPKIVGQLAHRAFADVFTKGQIEDTLRLFYHRFTKAQFKRSSLADGPMLLGFSLSPRGGYVIPSDLGDGILPLS